MYKLNHSSQCSFLCSLIFSPSLFLPSIPLFLSTLLLSPMYKWLLIPTNTERLHRSGPATIHTHTHKHTPLLQAVKTHFSSCRLGHGMQTYTCNQSRPGMFVHLNAECFMNTSGNANRAAAGKHWFTGSIRRLIQHCLRAGTCANPPNQFIQHFPPCLKSVSKKLVLSAIQYTLTHFFRQPPQEPNTIPPNVKTLSKGNFTLVLG